LRTHVGSVVSGELDADLHDGINSLTQEQGATLFMGLLAAVNVLLYMYTHQEDIVIGTSVAGREHHELADQLGFYVNTLALRARLQGGYSYNEVLKNVKQVALGAYEHQAYPFDELVDALHLKRDLSRNPLLDVQVILQHDDAATMRGAGL